MKKHPKLKILQKVAALIFVVAATCGAGWLLAGCATSSGTSSVSRPGDGLRQYRELVTELRKATIAARRSVQGLAAATAVSSNAAFAHFDEALVRLEVDSVQARSRADAMEQRGAAYFDEWAEEIATTHDVAAQHTAKARMAELRQHFDTILADGRLVRQEFRKYLDGVRALRATPVAGTEAKPKPTFESVITAGQSAERQMDRLLATVQSALAAVQAGPVKPSSAGAKS